MRKLDFWVGVPLCFVCSVFNFFFGFLSPKREKNPPACIVFLKLSELGAIILAYPLIERIKDQYPAAGLLFVTFKKNKGIFRVLGGLIREENIILISDENIFSFISDTFKAVLRLRKNKIDIVFDLEFFSRFSALLSYLISGAIRVGFWRYAFEGLYRGNFLTHKAQYNPQNHISVSYLSLAQAIKQERKDSPELSENISKADIVLPQYVSSPQLKKSLIEKFGLSNQKKIFLFNPGEGVLPLREWGLENFIKVARKILEDSNNCIALIGTEGAVKKSSAFLKTLNNSRCINLIGKTSLEELMELFCMSAALISNDCGLVHLAMLTPIKKFVIFGPETPQVFGPLGENNHIFYSHWPCSPCLCAFNHRESFCRDNVCLKAISPEEILQTII
ncbi:MAG: glycosyltransferase family 9 protein [Candidatus Omnitrophota bacterium]